MIIRLVADFAVLRSSAGQPSYSKIAKESERLQDARTPIFGVRVTRLPKSTVHDLLHGDRSRPLRAELAESLWAVLRHIALKDGRRPSRLDSLEELRQRLAAIHVPERTRAAPAPRRPAQVGSGAVNVAVPEVLDPFGGPPPGADEDTTRRWLLDWAMQTKEQAWWHGGLHLLPEWLQVYLTLERRAAEVRAYSPRFVPGLLQTEGYAWAALRRDRPEAGVAELAGLVHLRMRRQEPLLQRRDALRCWAIVDESVLWAGICGPAAMRAQLDHLIRLARLPHVTIQVMPCGAAGHDAADGPVTMLRFPERGVPDAALIEQHQYGLFPDRSEDVGHYRKVLARLAIEALQPEESIEFLQKMHAAWPM